MVLVMVAVLVWCRWFFKKQQARIEKLEDIVEVTRRIHTLDDSIARSKHDNPTSWAKTPDGKGLVAKRIELHEEYCTYMGGHPIREIEYVNELMDASIRT